MVMEWQQSDTSLYFSGANKYIRIFDVSKEAKVADLLVGSEGVVTSLDSDASNSSIIFASCSDGYVRVFDRRIPPNQRFIISNI